MLEKRYPELLTGSTDCPTITVDWNLNAPIVARMHGRDELIVVSYDVRPFSGGSFGFKYVDGISPEGKITIHTFANGLLSYAPDAVLNYLRDDFDAFIGTVERTLSSVHACMVNAREDICDREPKADETH
jgi:hypothetical protein